MFVLPHTFEVSQMHHFFDSPAFNHTVDGHSQGALVVLPYTVIDAVSCEEFGKATGRNVFH
jgi:hypothetical protein